jgi:PAS domain S-box-containing protein
MPFLRADYEQRSIRLQETQLISRSTNFDELSSLTGSNTDLNNNYYQRLKNELASICAQNLSYRFVYLLGRKDDGTIFIFMDSEPVSSNDYSPPGQIFSEASKGIKDSFNTNQEFIEGPVSDRWGTWITTIVPIYDQETGKVIALFGIDSNAHLWYWSIIIKIVPIIILTLLSIISAIIFIFANKKPNLSSKTVLNQLLPPLIFLISLVIISSLFLFLQQQKKTTLSNLYREHAEIISNMHILLNEQAKALQSVEQSLVTDKTMRKALRNRDSTSLLAKYKGLFDTIHKENKVTHFYFFDANRVCFLRIHKPEKYGDKINRATAITAEQTKKTAFGIELGPLGTFTLRVVMPVFDDKTLIGYIELGKEIEDVLELIHNQTDFELAIAIDKKLLDQKAWENGMRLMDRQPDWDRLKRNAISYCSMGLLPDAFAEKTDHDPNNGHSHGNYNYDISFNNKRWHLSITTLIDYSGNDVGGLIIFSDTSNEQESFYHALILAGASTLLLLITLFGLIFSLLRRTDRNIFEQQKKLHEAKQRYDQLAVQSKTFTWETDTNGLYTYVSHTVEEVIGFSDGELSGKIHFYNLHPEEGREEFKNAALASFTKKEYIQNLSNKILTKNGETIWVNTNAFPVLDKQGNLIGYRGNDTDITKRILTETALYKSNEQLAATLRSIGEGVITCDKLGNILLLNTIAEELTGWKTTEATGLPIEDIFHIINSETGEPGINPVRESLKNNIIIEISSQTVLLSKDNCKYQIANSCSPIRDSVGNLLGAVLVFRNVTEKYIQEAELIKYAEKLETSNQELSAFTSIASHDLKAPLRGISNCATFLKLDHPDLIQPVQDKLTYIIELTENLNNLIDDLLSFSKLGNTGLTFNNYPLKDIVEESIENIKACDFFANAEINIKNLPEENILCNKERLKYVYQNLIANGLKYNTKKHKYIEIGHFDENKQRIYYVYDNGIGIEEKYHEEIFQIFKRLHGKNEYSGGTGVGLAIVKKVIMQHNGTVWIKSKLNEGTTFYFTINV